MYFCSRKLFHERAHGHACGVGPSRDHLSKGFVFQHNNQADMAIMLATDHNLIACAAGSKMLRFIAQQEWKQASEDAIVLDAGFLYHWPKYIFW